jgi:DNA topoisomerase-1
VVVESPAKARTIKRWLGSAWEVLATGGHLKDLPPLRLGVDVGGDFEPSYELIRGRAPVLSDIRRAARRAERVLLATDPDREGEAIAWHVAEELGVPGGDARVQRVLLREITPEAVRAAVERPVPLDRHRYESQKARRVLDRLVGWLGSPVVSARVRGGRSAGRVQSVAVSLVVERERLIRAFRPGESWTLEAELGVGSAGRLRARLVAIGGEAAGLDREGARGLARELARERFAVAAAGQGERLRPPPPPFTTAALLHEAWRRLGLPASRTMALARRLYEGVDVGEEGTVGLVTYVRTDSVRLSDEAVEAVRAHVAERHGPEYLPREPVVHRPPRHAQEAHEAIRPTRMDLPPERVGSRLRREGGRDLARLYALVWNRFVACQMAPASYRTWAVELRAGRAAFRAEEERLAFRGHLAAEGDDGAGGRGAGAGGRSAEEMPPLEGGDALRLLALVLQRQGGRPPPRFDEGSFVREMEERGLGRPSTYASIVASLRERGYLADVDGGLAPTALGVAVTDALAEAFPREMDPAFTAAVEEQLDRIGRGEVGRREVVAAFWEVLRAELERAGFAAAADPAARGGGRGARGAPAWEDVRGAFLDTIRTALLRENRSQTPEN